MIGLLVKVDVLAVPVAGEVWWLARVMAVATVIGLVLLPHVGRDAVP